MNGLKYLMLITNRDYAEQYTRFFKERELTGVLSYFALGTASNETLNCLGLEKTEKIVFNLMIREDKIPQIKKDLVTKMKISATGNGIAAFMSVDGIGGSYSKHYLLGDKPIERREELEMSESLSKTVLIVTIADKGNNETVMEAARRAGATGGTIVRAKGTGTAIAKFFGVSISDEKEMIYIVAKREKRDDIMRAIMEKAGKNSSAHGITFSIPVDSVCGISSMED